MKRTLSALVGLQLLCAAVGSATGSSANSLPTATGRSPESNGTDVVDFSDIKYFLRTAKDGQFIFTPRGQDAHRQWTDMITLNYYPEITEGKSLAAKAVDWWKHCRSNRAHILAINFVPRIDKMHAGNDDLYTVITLLERPSNDFDEFAYTALRIIGGVGTASTYSHREYRAGLISPERNFAWARKNEPVGEAWFVWDGIPGYQTMKTTHPSEPAPGVVH